MASFSIPGIFWTTLLSVLIILSLATQIGRLWGALFPYRLRAAARFYLAPVLGLATLTVIASVVGRYVSLGDSVIVPALILGVIVFAARELYVARPFCHCLWVSLFGLGCGVSVLAPLLFFGALNAHNDGFTYLAHSNWLQEHAFVEQVTPENVTPLTTQVSLYQQEGFRMGGSFLLALAQSLLNLQWSFEAFPAVVISAMASCCLAIGFPLMQSLRGLRRHSRFLLLALPSVTLGGLVFGASLGFLPQTLGLSLGSGFIFAVGPLLGLLNERVPRISLIKWAFPCALLFSAATFAYSELAPFLLVAVLGSGFIFVARVRTLREVSIFILSLLALSALLLNTELIRAYFALRTQSAAVVGSPVDWPLLGYAAHAFGLHGGAWDDFQWTLSSVQKSGLFVLGIVLCSLCATAILLARREVRLISVNGPLLPAALILLVFGVALLYFRYFVPSPFPVGKGQSWSQFKLADWANPFAMAFILSALIYQHKHIKRYYGVALAILFFLGVLSASTIAVSRITPLVQYYGNTRDLNLFYQEFRKVVLANCPSDARIYLALNGSNHKFRQMATYYLQDRDVASDWMDDGYIYSRLPVERRVQTLAGGDCIVEPVTQNNLLDDGATVGLFRVGMFDGQFKVRIVSVNGAYDRESDGSNWWYWVNREVTFRLQPLFVPNASTAVRLRFEYATRGKQILTISIRTRNGQEQQTTLDELGDVLTTVEKEIYLDPSELLEISIKTDGIASPLGERDPRLAAWMIRNLSLR